MPAAAELPREQKSASSSPSSRPKGEAALRRARLLSAGVGVSRKGEPGVRKRGTLGAGKGGSPVSR
jgi:hypothetical protein